MYQKLEKICLVTPIFSSQAFGGAERHAWEIAHLLSEDFEVHIVTTTALDYRTWKNFYKAGIENINNLYIYRFPVEKQRSLFFPYFHKKILKINLNLSDKEFEKWLKLQGPYCPDLVEFLKVNIKNYYKVFYFTYLYYPVVNSLPIDKKKSICILTLHDEPMAYFPQFKKLFTNEITYCFNTPEEKKLFEKIYDFTPSKYSIVGMHLDYLKPAKSIARKKPYVIYIGRIDAGKGILELISLFEEWLDYSQADLELLLIGFGKLPKLENSKIFQLGYIDEEEKAGYLEGAEFLINPSQVESFSIVIMEAWLKEKAVLVNAKSEIMKNHCIRSNGGLYYYDKLSFFRTMDYLLENPLKRKIMGQNGKRYVELNYNKERIQNKLKNLIYL